jgi:phosphatidylethanolamine/phosphatidyl-N-methylethanolamine N-methyltransferase
VQSSLSVLEPGGVLVQFTYRQSSPIPEPICDALQLTPRALLPRLDKPAPAGIWIYRKPSV